MTSSQSAAYVLAAEQRRHHQTAYDAFKHRVTTSGAGAATRLRTFESLLGRAKPAINMTLPACVRFLETGVWLNVYEKVAIDLGVPSGPDFDNAVREKLGQWYAPRQALERLLRFQSDTRYAALNLGGPGPDYGDWCVRLAQPAIVQFATVFAGDPLRWVFDEHHKQVLSDTDVLHRFATHDDRTALAANHSGQMLFAELILNETTMRTLLEDRETLVEVHIHGKVTPNDVDEIAVRKSVFDKLSRLSLDYEDASVGARTAKRFANVAPFKRLLQLLDNNFNILLKQEAG
jgi:hypothetical protein